MFDWKSRLTQPWSNLAAIGRRLWCYTCIQHQSHQIYILVLCLQKVLPRYANTDWQGLGWSCSCHHRGKTIHCHLLRPKKELRYVRTFIAVYLLPQATRCTPSLTLFTSLKFAWGTGFVKTHAIRKAISRNMNMYMVNWTRTNWIIGFEKINQSNRNSWGLRFSMTASWCCQDMGRTFHLSTPCFSILTRHFLVSYH